jgi:acetate kinase
MRVLVVNAGSSSLKLRLLDAGDAVVGTRNLGPGPPDRGNLGAWIGSLGGIDAVGHRIVHGGTDFSEPVLIDAAVEERLHALADLAPLHQAKALDALDAVCAVLPGVPAVACFDTAFHAGLPAPAATYALPAEWRTRWGLRRYGFHGISHAYAARRTAELLGRPAAELRIVTCHLGAGASLAAVSGGRCVDTTMGFTPLEGLVMATRSGSVDPGLVLWLQTHAGLSPSELAEALEYRSGLTGLAGTGDMVTVLARAEAGDEDARLAVEVYLHRLRALMAAMVAAMCGVDAVSFTGGVGENAPAIRAGAAAGLGFLGIDLDATRNEQGADGGQVDREIGRPGARVRCVIVTAREDLEIAREVRGLLGAGTGPSTPNQ